MFFTGTFSLDGVTGQRMHSDNDPWNDDVISWIDINDRFEDGYVSNIGDIATIHVRPGCLEEEIAFIKKMFGLYSKNGINQVLIVPFEGWQKVLENCNK